MRHFVLFDYVDISIVVGYTKEQFVVAIFY
jgi:hypothetical protein